MSTTLTVTGTDESPPTSPRLDRTTARQLGLEPGDVVAIVGDRRTVARVGEPGADAGTIELDEVTRRNAGVEPGESVRVSAVPAVPADAVTVAPLRSVGFRGESLSSGSFLVGRAVAPGDEVAASVVGGAVRLTFLVTDLDPEDATLVTGETAVTVRDRPATRSERRGTAAAGVSFDDVGGLVAERRRLVSYLAPLDDPDVRSAVGGPPTGVLLAGPPGVGKSLLARAAAGAVEAEVIPVSDPGAMAEYHDREGLADLLSDARSRAPAVVVLDPVGAVGAPAALGAFLDTLAGEDVVVVGTTDSPDELDESLRRGGRFGHEIEVGPPDADDRRAIIDVHVRDVRLADDVDLDRVARRTRGYVGADLRALVSEAVRNAVERQALPDGVDAPDDRSGLSVAAADFEAALSTVAPGGMREVTVERPDTTYDDIGGLTEAKREVIRVVEWPLTYPGLFDHLSTEPPSGVLLYGPPGTGKTMLARAVANSTDANFIAVSGPELLDRYVGESERAVREVFERARRLSPSVVFFDELDALAPRRGGESDTDVTERVVSQLLTELDGIEGRRGVVALGTTNRPDMLDPALLRPGRFERLVEVPLPDEGAREAIFDVHVRGLRTAGVDTARLAARTQGYSGGDIAAVVREAALLAMEAYLQSESFDPADPGGGDLFVTEGHFERALETVEPSVAEDGERFAER